jgi:hypothetical protein
MNPSPGNTPNSQNSAGNGGAGGKGALRSLGLAMSLPFTLIVCVGIGGGAGYFLECWGLQRDFGIFCGSYRKTRSASRAMADDFARIT